MKMTKRIVAVLFAVLMAMSVLSVSMTASAATKVTKVTLNKTSATMYTTRTLTLKAKVKPSKASNKKVKWTTSDKKIATVDKNGKVKALKKGKVTITATAKDGSGKKATCKITVKKLVKIKTMTLKNKTVNVGASSTLAVEVTPSKASIKTYKWSSSDTSIATVDNKGNVKGLKPGTVTITAAAKDGSGKKATCKVTVKKINVSSIKLDRTSATIYPGNTFTLAATVAPANATDGSVKWTSSNASVATVTGAGVVKGINPGTATITCAAKDGSGKLATCVVTVGVKSTSISITSNVDAAKSGWYVGKKGGKLTVNFTPANTTNKSVTWTSDQSYVTVDANGNVTINNRKLGASKTVNITAKANDSGATAKYTIKIVDFKDVSSIKFTSEVPSKIYTNVQNQVSFNATISPSGATEKQIFYTVSDQSVASIDQNGMLTAKKPGTVKVRATAYNGKYVEQTLNIYTVTLKKAEILNSANKEFFELDEMATFYCETSPREAIYDLGLRLESDNSYIASFGAVDKNSPESTPLNFTANGETKVRAVIGNNVAVSDWIYVDVREMKCELDYYQAVKKDDTFSVAPYYYNGKKLEDETISIIPDYDSKYFAVSYNPQSKEFDVKILNDLPENGARILFRNKGGNVKHEVWFVPGMYQFPDMNLSTVKDLSQKAEKVKTANVLKVVRYSNQVVDKDKSSTDLKINGLPLSGFLDFIGGLSDSEDADSLLGEIKPEAFIKELYHGTERDRYKYTAGSGMKYPSAISVADVDINGVVLSKNENKNFYKITLNLKDQTSYIALDAVSSSPYGKTMKVIDRDFMKEYKSEIDVNEVEDGAEMTTELDYGTITQKYKSGYVTYTVSKITGDVLESEYHYVSDMDIKDAKFKMTAKMDIDLKSVKSINMVTNINAYFTMTVESTTKYKAMSY